MATLRIPKRFYDDHVERDLPAPKIVAVEPSHYVISSDDEALPELINDAKHYADDFGPSTEGQWVRKAAKALLNSLPRP